MHDASGGAVFGVIVRRRGPDSHVTDAHPF